MHATSKAHVQEKACEGSDQELYRDLFIEAPVACFSVGVDGRIRAANKQALRLTGYRRSEVVGRWVLDLYADTPAGKAKAEEQFLQFRSGAEIRRAELEMRRADGASVWIALSATPIRDRLGQVAASCSVVEEIRKSSLVGVARLQQHHTARLFESEGRSSHLAGDRGTARELTKRFLIKSSGGSYFVRIEDIDWIGAAGNYVELHIGNKSHLMRKTMNALEAKLDARQFLRVHRSAIVNVERIKELRPWHYGDHKIVLFDHTQLTLKRCHVEKLELLVGEPI